MCARGCCCCCIAHRESREREKRGEAAASHVMKTVLAQINNVCAEDGGEALPRGSVCLSERERESNKQTTLLLLLPFFLPPSSKTCVGRSVPQRERESHQRTNFRQKQPVEISGVCEAKGGGGGDGGADKQKQQLCGLPESTTTEPAPHILFISHTYIGIVEVYTQLSSSFRLCLLSSSPHARGGGGSSRVCVCVCCQVSLLLSHNPLIASPCARGSLSLSPRYRAASVSPWLRRPACFPLSSSSSFVIAPNAADVAAVAAARCLYFQQE